MKTVFKRVLGAAFVLALAMGGLTACGRGDQMANAALAKENVYLYQEIELPELDGDGVYMRGSFRDDGKVYLLMEVDKWEAGTTDYVLISMNEDGSDVQKTTLDQPVVQTPDPAEMGRETPGSGDGTQSPADTDDVEDTGRDEASADEEAEPGEDGPEDESEDSMGDGESGEDGDDVLDEGIAVDSWVDDSYSNIWEGTYINNFSFGGGRIYATMTYSYEDYTDPDDYFSFRKNYICSWNADGSLVWQSELEGLQSEDEWVYVSTMIPEKDGSLSMILMGDAGYKLHVDANGNVGTRIALSDEVYDVFSNYQYVLPREDGSVLVVYSDVDDWNKQFLSVFDPETDSFGESKQLPANFYYGVYTVTAGLTADLLYSDGIGIWTLNAGDEDSVKKMDYINSDMNINYFDYMVELDENTFLGTFSEGSRWPYEAKAGIFTYVKPEDVPDKKVIVLAGSYISDELRQRVVEFNRSNQEYRITVKNYNSYNSYEDYYAGYTQLNNDIITGNMPDILIADSNLPVENYIAKGLIADVGKMIDNDEELSKVEFVQNVFDAYSIDGKLYYVIPSFNVRTLIAKTSIVGDRDTWTMDEMLQLKDTLPEGTNMLGDLTRSYFFNMVMQFCGTDFVDVDTGKCDFDSPGFIAVMEFAKTLPEEIEYDDAYWEFNWEAQYRENLTVLSSLYIGSFSNLNYSINGSFGEDVSFIGFPTDSGKGSVVLANEAYCISSRSANQDGAWEFIRYYLTDEYQDTLTYGLPIQKDNFLAKAQEATQRPYYIDSETGEKIEYDESYYMNGEEIPLPPMSQEQVDKIVQFIYSVDKLYYYNESIQNIINDEMESFYVGQKSAEEVAKIIQSRVQVYVDENR